MNFYIIPCSCIDLVEDDDDGDSGSEEEEGAPKQRPQHNRQRHGKL